MTKQPFEKLRFRIHNIPLSVNLLEEFSDLGKHKELVITTHQNEALRYLIYMYDPGSDLIREEGDLLERKKKALVLAGFKEGGSLYQKIIGGNEDRIQNMAFFFVTKVIHNRKFTEWHTLQQELLEINIARWTPIKESENKDQKSLMDAYNKKGNLRQQSMAIQQALDALEAEIFRNNDDIKKIAEVRLTNPESVAAAYKVN